MTGRVLLERPGGWRARSRPAAPAVAAPAWKRRETVEFEEAEADHASGDSGWTVGYLDLLLLLVTLFAALLGATYLQVNRLSAVEPQEIQPLARFDPPVAASARSEPDPAVTPTAAGPAAGSKAESVAGFEPAVWHAALAPILSEEVPPARAEPVSDGRADEAPNAPEPAASTPGESPDPPTVGQQGAEPSMPPAFEALMDLVAARGEREDLELLLDRHQLRLEVGDGILFDSGTADLNPTGEVLIEDLVTALQDERLKISLEGHTDDIPISTPRFPSNWELSSLRATTVARELITHGIPQERIRVTGHADTRPRAPNDSAANRALNRRVSLVLEMRDEPPSGSL